MILKPLSSSWAPSTGLLYTVADARIDLGLFSDTVFDARVTNIVQAAQDFVANILGGPVQSTARTDYYRHLAGRMSMSWMPTATVSVVLKWVAASGEVTFSSLATPDVASAFMFFDASAGDPTLILTEAGEDQASILMTSDPLNSRVLAPVAVSYSAGAVDQKRGTAAAKEVVRNVVADLFQQGNTEIGEASMQRAMLLLGPYVNRNELMV